MREVRTTPLKFIGQIVSGGTPKSDPENWDGLIPFITPPDLNGVDGGVVERWQRSITEQGKVGSAVVENAVLLSCRAPIGHIGFVSDPVAFNQGCKAIIPERREDLRYLGHALVAHRTALQAAGRGTTFLELSTTELASFGIPWPEPGMRTAIADYLDRETGEIDAMIAKLDELTGTLDARRTATVDAEINATTSAEVARLGLIAEAITGLTYAPADIAADGTVVHRSGNIQNGRIDRSDLVRVSTPIPNKLRFQQDDILVCSRNGSAHLVGKNAMVGPDEIGETWGAFMTVLRSPHARYVHWYLQSSLFARERSQFSTSTINQLTVGMIQRMTLPFPEPDEQKRIADHLDEVTGRIDEMLAKVADLKSLLLERRSALITDVVTGRKDIA